MKNYIKIFLVGWNYIISGLKVDLEDNRSRNAMLILSLIIFYGHIYYSNTQSRELERYKSYCVGVVVKIKSLSPDVGIYYDYTTEGKTYSGYLKADKKYGIKVGDSLELKYARTNPKNNKWIYFFRTRLDTSKLPDTVYTRKKIPFRNRAYL